MKDIIKKCKHCGDELPQNKRGLQCVTCKNGLDRYGLNRLDMIKMHEEQNGKCALCNKDIEMFKTYDGGCIDHCHKTGKVRSVLCHPCNTAIGYFEKREIDINHIVQYLT